MGGRYGKYGELKRYERLRTSREAKRQAEKNSGELKKKSGSRVQKFEHDKNFSKTNKKTNGYPWNWDIGIENPF